MMFGQPYFGSFGMNFPGMMPRMPFPRFGGFGGFGGQPSPYLGRLLQGAVAGLPQGGQAPQFQIPQLAGFLDPLAALQLEAQRGFAPRNTSTGDNRRRVAPERPPAHDRQALNRYIARRSGGSRNLPEFR